MYIKKNSQVCSDQPDHNTRCLFDSESVPFLIATHPLSVDTEDNPSSQ